MKFFKYLIFTLFTFLSINAFADYQLSDYKGLGTFSSKQEACNALKASYGSTFSAVVESDQCVIYTSSGSRFTSTYFIEVEQTCNVGESAFLDGYITPPDAFAPDSVCYKGCTWNSDGGGTAFDTPNGNLSWGINAKNTGAKCSVDTPKDEDKPVIKDGCKSGEAYCDKPTTGCPSGYTGGTYNGKQICVKNNPDPTKPNPNDPNNNPNSKFDDSKIIAAINDSKTAITNSINNAVNSINSSISTINQSITAVANAVNGTTNAVNNNTSAVNAVKSSVDALHNTINAVTTAVNNNTATVTNAVNANTSATNAVKASVDALNSTVSAVTSAVDNNTKVVNANGDKVANAVKDNITATNAVKTAVESLNSSVNAVTTAVNANGDKVANETKASGDKVTNAVNSVKTAVENLNNAVNAVTNAVNASGDKVSNAVNATGDKITNSINANGKNTVDAINAGTEATNENGKKLDKIDKNGKDLNDFVMGCKTDSSGNKTCSDPFDGQEQEDGKVDILENEIENNFDGSILDASASCPPPLQITFTLFQTHTLTYSYEYMCNIASFIRPIVIFIGMFIAFMIVTGQRSSNDA